MKKIILMVSIFFLLFPVSTMASTQQYNKIYLNPFYRNSMTRDSTYTYTLSVSPPDNIASVISAIINFDVYITPSINFTISVNNQQCNTPFYYISTTYAGAGQSRITFDCSNIIKKSGTYTITLKPTLANTGAITGWLDLTYMNNPFGEISFHGTEYYIGEYATIFLQLKDNAGNPVTTGNCYLSVWYPVMPNSSHDIFLYHAPMIFKNGSLGLYYYDLYVPNATGSYMLTAECSYIYTAKYYSPNRTVLQGTYIGDPFLLNDYEDWLYTSCSSTGGATKYCEAYYDYGLENTTVTNIDLMWLGESDNNLNLEFYVWNWTNSSWIKLINSAILHGTGANLPIGIDELVTNTIPDLNNTIASNKTIRIREITYLGKSYWLFDNWLALKASQEGIFIQDLKGSGEMHVHSPINISANITGFNTTDLENKITSVNGTVLATNSSIFSKLFKIQDEISSTNATQNLNFQNLNTNLNNNFNNLINHIDNAISGNFTYTNSLIANVNNTANYWSSSLTSLINYWGNSLETKIDGILGNITVSANVDYDEIALTVMQYLKALQKQEII